jgi:hypothetical protein
VREMAAPDNVLNTLAGNLRPVRAH